MQTSEVEEEIQIIILNICSVRAPWLIYNFQEEFYLRIKHAGVCSVFTLIMINDGFTKILYKPISVRWRIRPTDKMSAQAFLMCVQEINIWSKVKCIKCSKTFKKYFWVENTNIMQVQVAKLRFHTTPTNARSRLTWFCMCMVSETFSHP